MFIERVRVGIVMLRRLHVKVRDMVSSLEKLCVFDSLLSDTDAEAVISFDHEPDKLGLTDHVFVRLWEGLVVNENVGTLPL